MYICINCLKYIVICDACWMSNMFIVHIKWLDNFGCLSPRRKHRRVQSVEYTKQFVTWNNKNTLQFYKFFIEPTDDYAVQSYNRFSWCSPQDRHRKFFNFAQLWCLYLSHGGAVWVTYLETLLVKILNA